MGESEVPRAFLRCMCVAVACYAVVLLLHTLIILGHGEGKVARRKGSSTIKSSVSSRRAEVEEPER